MCFVFVPARIRGGVGKAEGAAEIDDLGTGVEHGGRDFHGDLGRRGEENHGQVFGANGAGRGRGAARLGVIDGGGSVAVILAMFEEDGLGEGVGGEEAEEFGAAVAVEADDADLMFIHPYE